jgi:hypothetical protein
MQISRRVLRAQGPGTSAASFLNSGTQGGRRSCLGDLLAYQDNSEQGGAYHATTKAALAGLRSGSIRSACYRHGYDCTARIEHLNLAPEPATRVQWGTRGPPSSSAKVLLRRILVPNSASPLFALQFLDSVRAFPQKVALLKTDTARAVRLLKTKNHLSLRSASTHIPRMRFLRSAIAARSATSAGCKESPALQSVQFANSVLAMNGW